MRSVRKMEVVYRVHFHPLGGDAQVRKECSGDAGRISKQWVEMRGGIKGVSVPPEGAAVSANHEMLFHQQHPQSRACQQIGADQPSHSCADNDRVVGAVRRLFETVEDPGQVIPLRRESARSTGTMRSELNNRQHERKNLHEEGFENGTTEG